MTGTADTLLIDGSRNRQYFTMLPNLIDDIPMSVYAFRLYVHIMRVVGAAEGGKCWQSTQTLADHCCMSVGMVAKAKRELFMDWAVISIVKVAGEHGEFAHDEITVRDLWQENTAWYAMPKEERQMKRMVMKAIKEE